MVARAGKRDTSENELSIEAMRAATTSRDFSAPQQVVRAEPLTSTAPEHLHFIYPMRPQNYRPTKLLVLLTMTALAVSQSLSAAEKPAGSPVATESTSVAPNKIPTGGFEVIADQALQTMKLRAEELKIKGVAVVAYCPGESIVSWSSKMIVVGHLSSEPSKPDDHGANLLGIAYTKAAEMADTLKDSGSKVRPPKTGEYGWPGGVIIRGKTGILIAAFSGGPSEDDVKVSQAGLAILAAAL